MRALLLLLLVLVVVPTASAATWTLFLPTTNYTWPSINQQNLYVVVDNPVYIGSPPGYFYATAPGTTKTYTMTYSNTGSVTCIGSSTPGSSSLPSSISVSSVSSAAVSGGSVTCGGGSSGYNTIIIAVVTASSSTTITATEYGSTGSNGIIIYIRLIVISNDYSTMIYKNRTATIPPNSITGSSGSTSVSITVNPGTYLVIVVGAGTSGGTSYSTTLSVSGGTINQVTSPLPVAGDTLNLFYTGPMASLTWSGGTVLGTVRVASWGFLAYNVVIDQNVATPPLLQPTSAAPGVFCEPYSALPSKLLACNYIPPPTLAMPWLTSGNATIPNPPRPSTLSLEAMVYVPSVTNGFIAGVTNSYYLSITNGYLRFTANIGGTYYSVQGPAVTAGKTYHLVGTYDGSTLKLYVNNTLAGSVSVTGSISPSTYGFSVVGGTTYVMYARLYSGDIGASGVSNNYNNPVNPTPQNLLLWVQLDPRFITGSTIAPVVGPPGSFTGTTQYRGPVELRVYPADYNYLSSTPTYVFRAITVPSGSPASLSALTVSSTYGSQSVSTQVSYLVNGTIRFFITTGTHGVGNVQPTNPVTPSTLPSSPLRSVPTTSTPGTYYLVVGGDLIRNDNAQLQPVDVKGVPKYALSFYYGPPLLTTTNWGVFQLQPANAPSQLAARTYYALLINNTRLILPYGDDGNSRIYLINFVVVGNWLFRFAVPRAAYIGAASSNFTVVVSNSSPNATCLVGPVTWNRVYVGPRNCQVGGALRLIYILSNKALGLNATTPISDAYVVTNATTTFNVNQTNYYAFTVTPGIIDPEVASAGVKVPPNSFLVYSTGASSDCLTQVDNLLTGTTRPLALLPVGSSACSPQYTLMLSNLAGNPYPYMNNTYLLISDTTGATLANIVVVSRALRVSGLYFAGAKSLSLTVFVNRTLFLPYAAQLCGANYLLVAPLNLPTTAVTLTVTYNTFDPNAYYSWASNTYIQLGFAKPYTSSVVIYTNGSLINGLPSTISPKFPTNYVPGTIRYCAYNVRTSATQSGVVNLDPTQVSTITLGVVTTTQPTPMPGPGSVTPPTPAVTGSTPQPIITVGFQTPQALIATGAIVAVAVAILRSREDIAALTVVVGALLVVIGAGFGQAYLIVAGLLLIAIGTAAIYTSRSRPPPPTF